MDKDFKEKFLDKWWKLDKESYDYLYKIYRGNGKQMIDALQNWDYTLFEQIMGEII